MRQIAGNVLIGLAVLGAAGAVLMTGASIVEMRRTYPTSDRHAVAEGGLLLAGALLALDGHSIPDRAALAAAAPCEGRGGTGRPAAQTPGAAGRSTWESALESGCWPAWGTGSCPAWAPSPF